MPIQTSVVWDHDVALKGQALEEGLRFDVSAYADLAVDFGVGLVYDSANGGTFTRDSTYVGSSPKVKVPTATGGKFMGVAKRVQKDTWDNPDFLTVVTGTQDINYREKEEITVRSRGRIWVYSEQAVSPADDVYLRCLTNSTLLAGDFRKDANSATITTTALTSNVATITTSVAHGFVEGQSVVIAGLATNTVLNGTRVIASVPTSTTFTFALTNANIASGSEAGTIARADQITNARWVSKTSGAGLAELELL